MFGSDVRDEFITDDSGIVDQNVNVVAESCESGFDDFLRGGGLAEIALDLDGGAVGFGLDAGDKFVGAGFGFVG